MRSDFAPYPYLAQIAIMRTLFPPDTSPSPVQDQSGSLPAEKPFTQGETPMPGISAFAGGTVRQNNSKVPKVGQDIRGNGRDLRMNAHANGTKPGDNVSVVKEKAMSIVAAHAKGTKPKLKPNDPEDRMEAAKGKFNAKEESKEPDGKPGKGALNDRFHKNKHAVNKKTGMRPGFSKPAPKPMGGGLDPLAMLASPAPAAPVGGPNGLMPPGNDQPFGGFPAGGPGMPRVPFRNG